eukprot:TRINITY_DN24501_c0_g1_i2.p1 TRINITY_DN24501_c0_g1~~TRINITY_DN24501_c0_g1_i2.p1  ORF type:complete len:402 (-),score=63.48 TRINITY_DN24501_c0_g1_i2:228-1433(-)
MCEEIAQPNATEANTLPDSPDGKSEVLDWPPSTKSQRSRISLDSSDRYADPGQTLIFLDWDDTLFPTSEIFNRWQLEMPAQNAHGAGGIRSSGFQRQRRHRGRVAAICSAMARALLHPCRGASRSKVEPFGSEESKHGDSMGNGPSKVQCQLLEQWGIALEDYLTVACGLSDRVVIVTNARGNWVEACIRNFVPRLQDLVFPGSAGGQGPGPGKIKVVYARDFFDDMHKKGRVVSNGSKVRDKVREMTQAKFHVMKHEAKAFYNSYPGQTWKNIVSFGDMPYEHEAVLELGMSRRSPASECLRIKSFLLPNCCSITELTLRLKFSRVMLPVYVHFDGDLQLNLRDAEDPLKELSEALGLPGLFATGFPRHAWGRSEAPKGYEQIDEALRVLERTVADSAFR